MSHTEEEVRLQLSSSMFFIIFFFFFLFWLFREPYEPKPVLYSALTVVRGHSAPMDLVRVETKSQVRTSYQISICTLLIDLSPHFYLSCRYFYLIFFVVLLNAI